MDRITAEWVPSTPLCSADEKCLQQVQKKGLGAIQRIVKKNDSRDGLDAVVGVRFDGESARNFQFKPA